MSDILLIEKLNKKTQCLYVQIGRTEEENTRWRSARFLKSGLLWYSGKPGRRLNRQCRMRFGQLPIAPTPTASPTPEKSPSPSPSSEATATPESSVCTTPSPSASVNICVEYEAECYLQPVATTKLTLIGNFDVRASSVDLDALFGATRLTGGTLDAVNAGSSGTGAGSPELTHAMLSAAAGFQTTFKVLDSLGVAHVVSTYFYKDDSLPNAWELRSYVLSDEVDPVGDVEVGEPRLIDRTHIVFASTGVIPENKTFPDLYYSNIPWNNGSDATQDVVVFFSPFAQYAFNSSICSVSQDGIDSDGNNFGDQACDAECYQPPVATTRIDIEGNVDEAGAEVDLDTLFGATRLTGGTLDAVIAGTDGTIGGAPNVTFTELNNAAEFSANFNVLDGLGERHKIDVYFYKNDSLMNTWEIRAYAQSDDVDPINVEVGEPRLLDRTSITFPFDGNRVDPSGISDLSLTNIPWNNGSVTTQAIDVFFYPYTQSNAASSICSISQNGVDANGIALGDTPCT